MIRSVVVTLAAATLLTACIGGSDKEPTATRTSTARAAYVPQAGDCLAEEPTKINIAPPDFTAAVKCTSPHVFEVTGTTAVPDRFLDRTADPADARRQLLDDSETRQSSFHRYAKKTCSNHVWRTLDVDADTIRSGDVRLSEIAAYPLAAGVTYRHALAPASIWRAGQRLLICYAEFRDWKSAMSGETQTPVSSYNLKTVIQKFLGQHFPAERRRCFSRVGDDEGGEPVPCSEAHDAEGIFSFDGGLAFGPKYAKTIQEAGEDITPDMVNRTVDLCVNMLPRLLEASIDPALTVWIWHGHTEITAYNTYDAADEANFSPAECQLRPTDPSLVLAPGTVTDRASRPELEHRLYRSDT